MDGIEADSMSVRIRKSDGNDDSGEREEFEAAFGKRVNDGKDCPSEYQILKAQEKLAKGFPLTADDLRIFEHERDCPYCRKFASACKRVLAEPDIELEPPKVLPQNSPKHTRNLTDEEFSCEQGTIYLQAGRRALLVLWVPHTPDNNWQPCCFVEAPGIEPVALIPNAGRDSRHARLKGMTLRFGEIKIDVDANWKGELAEVCFVRRHEVDAMVIGEALREADRIAEQDFETSPEAVSKVVPALELVGASRDRSSPIEPDLAAYEVNAPIFDDAGRATARNCKVVVHPLTLLSDGELIAQFDVADASALGIGFVECYVGDLRFGRIRIDSGVAHLMLTPTDAEVAKKWCNTGALSLRLIEGKPQTPTNRVPSVADYTPNFSMLPAACRESTQCTISHGTMMKQTTSTSQNQYCLESQRSVINVSFEQPWTQFVYPKKLHISIIEFVQEGPPPTGEPFVQVAGPGLPPNERAVRLARLVGPVLGDALDIVCRANDPNRRTVGPLARTPVGNLRQSMASGASG